MPHPESRRPGEPLTLDDLEIAKKLDPKVRVDGKWHQKKEVPFGTETKNYVVGFNKFVCCFCMFLPPEHLGEMIQIWTNICSDGLNQKPPTRKMFPEETEFFC